jgi:UDP-2,3-diacylglucosamine pyrophosphatase LpxH
LSETRPESQSKYTHWKSDIEEGNNDAGIINELTKEYKVFVRHGDYYDMFNFDIEKGRDYSTLGDAFTMEVCNRFPKEVERMPGINVKFADELRQITNVRPALATPLWVTGQLKRISQEKALRDPKADPKVIEAQLKEKWDQLGDNFLNLDFVRRADKWGFDMVDKMQLVVKLSKTISSKQMDDLVYMMQNRNATGSEHSFARFALKEPAFLQPKHPARYIVYGHTHHQETVPLDYNETEGAQVYFNSGTWHTYFDLARKNLKEKKFVPYKALTYVTFFKSSENDNPDVEHGEQNFETWSGAYA